MKAKMVFFDCDGTLIEIGLWKNLYQSVGIIDERNYKWMKQYYDGEITFDRWIDQISECLRPKLTRQIFEKVMAQYTLFPDSREITQYLHDQHIPMAIISSGSDYYVSRVADALGINIWRANSFFLFDENDSFIQMKYTYEDPVAKTNHVKDICLNQGIQPAETIFVGDSYNDIEAFKLTTHGILYKNTDEALTKHCWKWINNLNEIKDLLEI